MPVNLVSTIFISQKLQYGFECLFYRAIIFKVGIVYSRYFPFTSEQIPCPLSTIIK